MASVSEKQMAMAMEKMEKAKGVQAPVVVPAKPVEEAEKPVEKAETKKVSKASSKE